MLIAMKGWFHPRVLHYISNLGKAQRFEDFFREERLVCPSFIKMPIYETTHPLSRTGGREGPGPAAGAGSTSVSRVPVNETLPEIL